MEDRNQLIGILTKYVATVLNISIDNDFIIMDIQEELENIPDLQGFRNYMKESIAKQDKDFDFKTPFQKFLILTEKFKHRYLEITLSEHKNIIMFCDNLYSKITWYFDELQFSLPTETQLKHQPWKEHQYKGKDLISEKEAMVVDEIGTTVYIYRLATRNKPLLAKRIREVTEIFVKNKKRKQLSLSNMQKRELIAS